MVAARARAFQDEDLRRPWETLRSAARQRNLALAQQALQLEAALLRGRALRACETREGPGCTSMQKVGCLGCIDVVKGVPVWDQSRPLACGTDKDQRGQGKAQRAGGKGSRDPHEEQKAAGGKLRASRGGGTAGDKQKHAKRVAHADCQVERSLRMLRAMERKIFDSGWEPNGPWHQVTDDGEIFGCDDPSDMDDHVDTSDLKRVTTEPTKGKQRQGAAQHFAGGGLEGRVDLRSARALLKKLKKKGKHEQYGAKLATMTEAAWPKQHIAGSGSRLGAAQEAKDCPMIRYTADSSYAMRSMNKLEAGKMPNSHVGRQGKRLEIIKVENRMTAEEVIKAGAGHFYFMGNSFADDPVKGSIEEVQVSRRCVRFNVEHFAYCMCTFTFFANYYCRNWRYTALSAHGSREVLRGTGGRAKGQLVCGGRTQRVAVCVARTRGVKRLAVEIQMLKHVGKHPHIAELLYSHTCDATAYFALEAVEPIGFDLDRLAKQYVFAKQSVPVLLAQRLINQLADALKWMHSRKVVHRDVKSENVLVTRSYDAKLIDFGIAIPWGGRVWAPKTYMAPELCAGNLPQLHWVDSWGLGVVLHQMYQHRWDIIDCTGTNIKMRPNRPCLANPMSDDLREAMLGLLRLEEASRLTLEDIEQRLPADEQTQAGSRSTWRAPVADGADTRRWLKKYRGSAPPLTAYAAVVDSRNGHLVGKKVGELDLRNKYGATLVLMDVPANPSKEIDRVLVKSPNFPVIREGAWLYFGLPHCDSPDETIAELRQGLFPHIGNGLGRSVNSKDGLMVFTLEFDCFSFPEHISSESGPRSESDQGRDPGARPAEELRPELGGGHQLQGHGDVVSRARSRG
ncbi:unnamed protein product [Prorocentrum cordatum]|uniref:Protein kinase domain-containing protein n=1 Tax=Prorocentrum cordatum TaxID=2364126 RepID=A0ABN9S3E4_9DINO|nr:unnamed protein product [Polarella glacialis]